MASDVPDALLEAYRATDYRVEILPPLVLKVDCPSPGLALLYARWGVTSAAFITAWNPLSQPMTPEENARRGERLRSDVQGMGLVCLEGRGCDPTGAWPPEDSLLILGIARPRAMELGEHYRQNAIVWAEADAIPRLLLLR